MKAERAHRGGSFGDVVPKGVFDGFLVVVNEHGEPGIIAPEGADPADAPTAAVLLCVELAKERTYMNEPILRFFEYAQLPPDLQAVSRPFCDLAHNLVRTLPRSAERTVALRKLLEGKDAAVRAALPIPDQEEKPAS